MNRKPSKYLQAIPSVEKVKQLPRIVQLLGDLSDEFVTDAIREVLEEIRAARKKGSRNEDLEFESIEAAVVSRIEERRAPPLRRVINGTGIVIHTNLGRSMLGAKAAAAAADAAASYVNLEYDLETGERGHRDSLFEPLLCRLTGAEAATVVNNNAAAVMLTLDSLARGREVVVSRGELIEIGGSFRIPDVMAKSGAKLVEVGTTNRTYIGDYERALSPETGLLLKVHPSNYRIIGFTQSVSVSELVELGNRRGIPVMEDLGSGALIDMSRFGIPDEPMAQHSMRAGADIVTFSGDKLLGGPQAGIILGKREYIKEIRKNPLMRALRVDKIALAALGSILQTLRSSRFPEKEIPTLGLIARTPEDILKLAQQVYDSVDHQARKVLKMEIREGESRAGGGSSPEHPLPTYLLAINPGAQTPDQIAYRLRMLNPPIIGIIRKDCFCLDFRTIQSDENTHVIAALRDLATRRSQSS
ncbi:MAG: L-seryl-tRNA(Sec) selenium transferase [Candidatus Abyssobacteria bacterium SURF_5]|uniref:L-seryl-tRNA(Sec) selenium transferase n=1 Tax=Abyssobacteria bacterium (strain SURF_5) TaxID=2093360 RepID=A0A3A4NUD2_ABYX5|nr:MAG: L-seryl-tRNA(Sec) selenium transferase [Candidatus Abyssubacteria bacterium SURF_5]